ncbi:glycoside hydrolase family 25 protein [Haliangium sp. UPWRP_2]|uniref:glycoside hydrolase family 25 protein n=1 Tax=Haliangium sp. UPWRP_2 TaxID=1931276 RepID=UPI001304D117|nr:glycoside hydrolase family 25 protein [Haliangium sp. UPWRP_2]
MSERRVLDLYSGQGTVDWNVVARSGQLAFAIIKASEGATLSDSRVERNGLRAAASGIPISYYHFARPDLGDPSPPGDARQEAEHFLSTIADLPRPTRQIFQSGRTAAVWLDLEKPIERWNEREGFLWVTAFLAVVEKQHPVGLYTSRAWLEREVTPLASSMAQLLNRPDGSQRAIWVARYGMNDGQVPDRTRHNPDDKVPPEWGSYDLWQYTSQGDLPGVPTPCDLSLARLRS